MLSNIKNEIVITKKSMQKLFFKSAIIAFLFGTLIRFFRIYYLLNIISINRNSLNISKWQNSFSAVPVYLLPT